MTSYPLDLVVKTLKEACGKFALTKNLQLKKVKFVRSKQHYLVTLADSTQHIIPQEIVNTYIENLGDRGGLEIAGFLRHSIELEESALTTKETNESEVWDGDMNAVYDYLQEKEEKEESKKQKRSPDKT